MQCPCAASNAVIVPPTNGRSQAMASGTACSPRLRRLFSSGRLQKTGTFVSARSFAPARSRWSQSIPKWVWEMIPAVIPSRDFAVFSGSPVRGFIRAWNRSTAYGGSVPGAPSIGSTRIRCPAASTTTVALRI